MDSNSQPSRHSSTIPNCWSIRKEEDQAPKNWWQEGNQISIHVFLLRQTNFWRQIQRYSLLPQQKQDPSVCIFFRWDSLDLKKNLTSLGCYASLQISFFIQPKLYLWLQLETEMPALTSSYLAHNAFLSPFWYKAKRIRWMACEVGPEIQRK